jgi:hypothetical protein
MKRLLDYDPETGIRQTFVSTGDGGFQIVYEQDCEHILQRNHDSRGQGKWGASTDSEMRKVAEIPITVQMKWLIDHGIDCYKRDHWPGVRRLLNSNEYRYLKTAEVII